MSRFNARMRGGAADVRRHVHRAHLSKICDVTDPNSLRFCDQTQYHMPWQTLFKIAGTYPLPFGLQVSGMFQSTPTAFLPMTYLVTRAIAPTLTQPSVSVPLAEPGSQYNDRVNQFDITFAKIFRTAMGGTRADPARSRAVQRAQRQSRPEPADGLRADTGERVIDPESTRHAAWSHRPVLTTST